MRYPDIQYHFLPRAVRYDGRPLAAGMASRPMSARCGSKSRGTVRLRSADPREPPGIRLTT